MCILIDPLNTDAVYISGLYSYYKGDLGSGLTYFQKALALDPDHIKARIMRFKAKNLKEKKDEGDCLFRTGRFREAHDVYTETLKIDSSNVNFNAKVHFNRALMITKMMWNMKGAIDDTTTALKMVPNYVKAYLLRAKCHNEMKNYDECVKDYEAALNIENSSEIKRLLNDVTHKLKRCIIIDNWTIFAKLLMYVIRFIYFSLADNKKNTGDEHYNDEKYTLALLSYSEAIKLFPKYAGYYCDKSKCLYALKNYKDALEASQYAVKLDGKSEYGHDFIMKCSLILGNILIACATMKKLTAIDSNNIVYRRYETKYTKLKSSIEMAMQCLKKKNYQTAGMLAEGSDQILFA